MKNITPAAKERQTNLAKELQALARNHRWAFDELVVDAKMQEANRLCSDPSVKPMFDYLRSVHGDAIAVISQLRYIVQYQKTRAKSLLLKQGNHGH